MVSNKLTAYTARLKCILSTILQYTFLCIDRAIERYARGVQHKEVAAVLDTSAFKSGKTGFLLTDRYLYSDKCKEEVLP